VSGRARVGARVAGWDAEWVRAGVGGRWLVPPDPSAGIFGASIDTRELEPRQVFFALRGQRTDGHEFIDAAREAGAAVAVVERDDVDPVPGLGVLRVERVERALVDLARARRGAMRRARVVAVTGSVGKTTAVRLVAGAIGQAQRTFASAKSHNNRLGVSLTLLNAPPDAEVVVSEVGTSAPGEIAALGGLVQPDIAVITAIGRAHLEALGSIEGVAREKASLVRSLRERGLAMVPAGIDALERALPADRAIIRVDSGMIEGGARQRERRGASTRDVRVSRIESGEAEVRFEVRQGSRPATRFRVPMPGRHTAMNGALAVCVARALGVDDEAIARGLAGAQPPPMRACAERIGPVRVINDAYNANPESMAAAIELLAESEPAPGGRRLAILGDMLELGQEEAGAHREVLERLARAGIDRAALLGPRMTRAAHAPGWPRGWWSEPEPTDDACRRAASAVEPGDVVLVKASRSVRLERVIDAIRDRVGVGSNHPPVESSSIAEPARDGAGSVRG